MTYLGVNSRGKITQGLSRRKVFWRYVDLNGNTSDVYAFSDRLGEVITRTTPSATRSQRSRRTKWRHTRFEVK